MKSFQFASFLLIVLCFSGNALAISKVRVARMFEQFKATHNKVYATQEEHDLRMRIFNSNLQYIEQHNKEYHQGVHTYDLGINHFGDMTNEEFKQNVLSPMGKPDLSGLDVFETSNGTDIPDSVDWKEQGYVTEGQNQGLNCGSCWAFSAVGAIEGAHFKATGDLVKLSEQNLVDCDTKSFGCSGGLMSTAFEEVISAGGIDTEESYPYEAKQKSCRFNNETIGATISSYKRTPSGNEDALKAATAEVGPISIAIDASPITFQFYKSGVYSSWFCHSDADHLNHGILLVGYGSQQTILHGERDYWYIKNSWGQQWGAEGFGKIQRNGNNMCGVATDPVYPIV